MSLKENRVVEMISVREALEIALQQANPLPAKTAPLLESLGHVLAEAVAADVDMPPFPRSSMDGYAVRSEDVRAAPVTLQVVGTVAAGAHPDFSISAGQAAKIMTGAPLPAGADAVQMIEKTRPRDGESRVELLESVQSGSNVAPLGNEARRGDLVLSSGTSITPGVIGLLAAVGKTTVSIYAAPSVAILATGDELVEINQRPQSGQIRNSNSVTLFAQAQQAGCRPQLLGIAKDDKSHLRQQIAKGLTYELFLITGGVSMGDLDLVGDIFREFDLKIFFDKVAIKPGKPAVMAKSPQGGLIFGLPGNPVSATTVFEVLVRPVIRKMTGFRVYQNQIVFATLTERFVNRSGRENYAPAITRYEDGRFSVQPLKSKGSADMVTYAKGNSYLICPIHCTELNQHEEVSVMLRPEFLVC
jgi:molybdopterin molybdotransferase